MYAFFVLGLVPGTNFQISFELWLHAVIVLAGISILSLVTINLYRFFKFADDITVQPAVRAHMHASQLHRRAQ